MKGRELGDDGTGRGGWGRGGGGGGGYRDQCAFDQYTCNVTSTQSHQRFRTNAFLDYVADMLYTPMRASFRILLVHLWTIIMFRSRPLSMVHRHL